CIVHGYCAEFRVRHRSGVDAEAKDSRVLTRERHIECRTVREVSMQNLDELGMRDADVAAPDRRHASDSGILKRIAKGISADHSCGADDCKALLSWLRKIHARS